MVYSCFAYALLVLYLCCAYALLLIYLCFTCVFGEGVRDPGAAVTALVATAMIRVLYLAALPVQKYRY
jgi:multisubunit Na+/H+ antiporter MnhB subunit